MFLKAYQRAASILARRPIKLWGLSLLSGVVCFFACLLSMPALAIVGTGFAMVVSAGMSKVYLDALDGKEINSDQLFAGFKRVWTVLGGIAWKMLWIFIWNVGATAVAAAVFGLFYVLGVGLRALAPFTVIGSLLAIIIAIGGAVLVVAKTYSYRFVEYILMTRQDVSATQALRLSMTLTRGKKGQMFLADLIFTAAAALSVIILSLLTAIPYVGSVFAIILLAFVLALILFSAIFKGLYTAAFYQMPEVQFIPEYDFDARMEQFAEKLTQEPQEETAEQEEHAEQEVSEESSVPQEEAPAPQEEPQEPQE